MEKRGLAQSQLGKGFEQFFKRMEPRIQPDDLRVRQSEMLPDPINQGQEVQYQFQRFDHCLMMVADCKK